jgi:hypothetical protein
MHIALVRAKVRERRVQMEMEGEAADGAAQETSVTGVDS